MAAPRRRLGPRRRRHDDDGPESVVGDDDSQSGDSLPSDLDEDLDDGASADENEQEHSQDGLTSQVKKDVVPQSRDTGTGDIDAATAKFQQPITDTEAMMNGLKISDTSAVEEMDFNSADAESALKNAPGAPRQESFNDRARREHEEYKKRRAADPAFVPNRGEFFMHDTRADQGGRGGFGRGRGRGRGGWQRFDGPGRQNGMNFPPSFGQGQWRHDLHESTIVSPQDQYSPQIPNPVHMQTEGRPNDFSRSIHLANVQPRVFMAGMKEPIRIKQMAVYQHTKLPNTRPPMRRDKPVRISMPGFSPRYVHPTTERSFVFIPRALRPNQQGHGRGKSGGSMSNSFSASRNGGSNYAASLARSRRSSMAPYMSSPQRSMASISRQQQRPIVKLPQHSRQSSIPPQAIPYQSIGFVPPVFGSMPSMTPEQAEIIARPGSHVSLPMHQPQPHKTVHVGNIDNQPFMLQQNNLDELAFQSQNHNQVPPSMAPSFEAHSRRTSFPSHVSTPLQPSSERPFVPPYNYMYPMQSGYYPPQAPSSYNGPPMYFYPGQEQNMPLSHAQALAAAVVAPPFIPGQHYGPQMGQQGSMIAHESNGMVYYFNPMQMGENSHGHDHAQAHGYARPHVAGYNAPAAVYGGGEYGSS